MSKNDKDLVPNTDAIPLLRSDFQISTAASILLKQWAARKGVESNNRLNSAIAENYRLQALVKKEQLNLKETEELFNYLGEIKKKVKFTVQADVEEQKERLNRLKRENDIADELAENAKAMAKTERQELKARELEASLRVKKLEAQLAGDEPKNNFNKKIKKAEKRLRKLQEEELAAKTAAGGSLPNDVALDFETRKGKLKREIDNLYDQKSKQDYEANS